MSLWFAGTVVCSCLSVAVATAKDADAQNNFNDKYLKSYLPPGDEHYTASWVGQNSSWRNYMSQYSGKSADYQKYLSEYGGPQANYDQYVSLYASMAGADVTSGNNYMSKGKSQLDAWNKSMMTTYNLYIPGAYENFAEQATEERTENKGQGVGQGTMSEGHGGGGGQAEGSGGGEQMPWMPKSGQEEAHSQSGGGGGSGEVGYEPFARPWVVQYATEEGGNNAFDYEGKEFASGGMQMGGVQDYADYMNQYAAEWVPADSIDSKHSEHSFAGAKGDGSSKSSKQSSKDEKSKKAAQQKEDKDQKEKKQKKPQDDDQDSKAVANHGLVEEKSVKHLRAQKSSKDQQSSKGRASGHGHEGHDGAGHVAKEGNSSKAPAVFFESGKPTVPEAHPAQPVLPRWSVAPQTKELDRGMPHPAQPVLPQLQSKAAKEAITQVRQAVKQLQQAAQDTSYAAWTLAKHSPSSQQTAEHQQLAEAMARLWKVTREPLTDKSLEELEDAGRAASTAIGRLQDSEMKHLRRSATQTRQELLKGAKDWSDQVQRDARKQENEQLAQEAKEAGKQLEKSLSAALSERTQKQAQELLLHAQQRKQLLQGVLGEAVDVAHMTKETPSADLPREPPAAPQVEAEEAAAERHNFTTDKLKAVSGTWLLAAITLVGLMYSVAGFVVRRNSAPIRPPSREIALLSLGEP